MVHKIMYYTKWQCTQNGTVHKMAQYTNWYGTQHGTIKKLYGLQNGIVHIMVQYTQWYSTQNGIVHKKVHSELYNLGILQILGESQAADADICNMAGAFADC